MNKKLNTALFLVGATLANMLIMFIVFVLLLIPTIKLFAESNAAGYMLVADFVVAIAATFFIYNRLMKLFQKKVDMEKYFHPLFGRKRQ